jgi:hypothetical protein
MNRHLVVAMLLAVTLMGCAHSSATRFEGDAVEYSGIVFDRAHRMIGLAGRRTPYEDCSTDEYFCLRSDEFDMVVPRACSPSVLRAGWRYGDIEMRPVAEAHNGNDPHIGVGFSTYIYRPSTKPDSLILIVFTPLTAGADAGRGYILQMGRTRLSRHATPDDIASYPDAWHRLSRGRPLGECAT